MVRFEHGEVDPEAFEKMHPEINIKFPTTGTVSGEAAAPSAGALPKIDLKIGADGLVYSNTIRSVKGKQNHVIKEAF